VTVFRLIELTIFLLLLPIAIDFNMVA
jgi:hypothetical protein